MNSLVGKAVAVYLVEEEPRIKLEGRIEEARDGLLEVRLARRDLSSLKGVLKRTLRTELEYVDGREVWGMPCRLESYGTLFPPVLVVRPTGGARLIHRRRHQRHATNLPVRVIARAGEDWSDSAVTKESWEDGRLVNLSRGGAAVSLPLAPGQGTGPAHAAVNEVMLQFVAGEMITARSRVMRREMGPEALILGVEFLTLSNHDFTCLEKYLSALERHGGIAAEA